MSESTQESRWIRLQRGQALVEYWATLPAAVAIMFSAALIATNLNSIFLKTANGLDRYCQSTFTDMVAPVFQHTIESSAYSYDPQTNRTTVAYTVTSGTQPSISHWVLGIPKAVANRVLQTSEAWSWTESDPTTGAKGMKFDIGYNPTGGTETGKGGKGNGKNSNKIFIGPMLQTATEERVISITLEGPYQFGALSVTIKAGNTQVGSGTVSGPVAPKEEQTQNSSGGVDRSKGC